MRAHTSGKGLGRVKRSVPVVCLMFGGGVNTIAQVVEHIQNRDPVLVIEGSGRAADLVSEFVRLHAEILEKKSKGPRKYAMSCVVFTVDA